MFLASSGLHVEKSPAWNWSAIIADMTNVIRILNQIEDGNPSAADQFLPLVYEELRKLAAAKLPLEKPGQTLQATALVHDTYLRLVDVKQGNLDQGAGEGRIARYRNRNNQLVGHRRRYPLETFRGSVDVKVTKAIIEAARHRFQDN